jgi:hypothetical protein
VEAITVAKISNFSDDSLDNTTLLQCALSKEGLSDLQRAERLWEYGDKMRLI